MNKYYRYINDPKFNENDIILLEVIESYYCNQPIPEWFKVVYSNVKEHTKSFIGKEFKLMKKNIQLATEDEIKLLNHSTT